MSTRDFPGAGDNGSGKVVFYYSRERRLEKASPAVRALYEGDAPMRGGIKGLGGKKSNLFLLVSILIVCVTIVLGSRISGAEKGFQLEGNRVALGIVRNDEGNLSVVIQKTISSSGEIYTGMVAIAVSPVIPKKDQGKTPEIYTDTFFFSASEEENYRFDLPFGGEDFLVVLRTENERKGLRVKLKKSRG